MWWVSSTWLYFGADVSKHSEKGRNRNIDISFNIAICRLVFQSPPASLTSRHVEVLFSPLGFMLPSGICQVLPASQRAGKLYWHAGMAGFSSRSLVPVGYSAAKWLVWSVLLTLWQPPLFWPLFFYIQHRHTWRETSTFYVWNTEFKASRKSSRVSLEVFHRRLKWQLRRIRFLGTFGWFHLQ